MTETEIEGISIKDLLDRAGAKNEEFSELLKKINYASNEQKKLWKEIYENAVDDRMNAYLLYIDLYRHVSNNEHGHSLHSKTLSTYIERMAKSNDQLLKLSELIENSSKEDGEIDADALYDEISKNDSMSRK